MGDAIPIRLHSVPEVLIYGANQFRSRGNQLDSFEIALHL